MSAERLTEAQLAELERAYRAAEEWAGPTWEAKDPPDPDNGTDQWISTPDDPDGYASVIALGMTPECAQAAVAVFNAVPSLLAEVRALRSPGTTETGTRDAERLLREERARAQDEGHGHTVQAIDRVLRLAALPVSTTETGTREAMAEAIRWLEETHASDGDEGAVEILAMLRAALPVSRGEASALRDLIPALPDDSPAPWETSKHRKMGTVGDPRAWMIRRHEFNQPPYEGDLEEEWGIYPATGGLGPIALVAGEKNARFIIACVRHSLSASPSPGSETPRGAEATCSKCGMPEIVCRCEPSPTFDPVPGDNHAEKEE